MNESEKKYQEIYEKYKQYENAAHERNQKKIRVGLKVNIFLPMIFLVVSFITSSSKLIFLILWIASLFGIAFYLIYVEYTDYKMQERIHEFDPEIDAPVDPNALIGGRIVQSGDQASDKIDAIDQHIEDKKQEVAEMTQEVAEKLGSRVEELKQVAQDKIANRLKEEDEKDA